MIPSYRATKDIAIKQDIVEEIGRFYGYDSIQENSIRQTKPFISSQVNVYPKIKRLLAYGLMMRELYTYAFFDESSLNTVAIGSQEKHSRCKNPVSDNWQRLATSLMPNLF